MIIFLWVDPSWNDEVLQLFNPNDPKLMRLLDQILYHANSGHGEGKKEFFFVYIIGFLSQYKVNMSFLIELLNAFAYMNLQWQTFTN